MIATLGAAFIWQTSSNVSSKYSYTIFDVSLRSRIFLKYKISLKYINPFLVVITERNEVFAVHSYKF